MFSKFKKIIPFAAGCGSLVFSYYTGMALSALASASDSKLPSRSAYMSSPEKCIFCVCGFEKLRPGVAAAGSVTAGVFPSCFLPKTFSVSHEPTEVANKT